MHFPHFVCGAVDFQCLKNPNRPHGGKRRRPDYQLPHHFSFRLSVHDTYLASVRHRLLPAYFQNWRKALRGFLFCAGLTVIVALLWYMFVWGAGGARWSSAAWAQIEARELT